MKRIWLLLLMLASCSGPVEPALYEHAETQSFLEEDASSTEDAATEEDSGGDAGGCDPVPVQKKLVFLVLGQSNAVGYGAGAVYYPTVANAWFWDREGISVGSGKPGLTGAYPSDGPSVLKVLRDPTGGYGPNSSNAATGFSFLPRFAEELRNLGETRDLIFVPSAVVGTKSSQWTPNTPLAKNAYQLLSNSTIRLLRILQEGNAEVGGVIVWQGESDSATQADALAHADNWKLATAYLERTILVWAKQTHYWFVKLPSTAPSPSSSYPYWQTVRNEQDSLAAEPKTLVVQAPDSPYLHLATGTDDTFGLRNVGKNLGTSWVSAP